LRTPGSRPATGSPITTTYLAYEYRCAVCGYERRIKGYRLTPLGLKLGVLLVKLQTRLLGPLATLVTNTNPHHPPAPHNSVDAAFRQVDAALDHLSAALGLTHAA
jgi:hypothetical protein